MNEHVERLTTYFTPEHYSLTFDFTNVEETNDFNGSVRITGTKIDAKILKLHALDLLIESVKINDINVNHTHSDGIVTLNSDTTGPITIDIKFNGTVTDAMHGIYPSYYKEDGIEKRLYATQFESHHAREAFPCVDEPAAKATFDLTYTTRPNVTALSNMPKIHTEATGENETHSFETTPKMSSYLLAFVFGDLHSVTKTTKNGTSVSIYSTQNHPTTTLSFALDSAIRSLEFFEDYFSTPYPLPKCDHIALPDFSSGAMENWGLITYRETCLIAADNAAISTKELIATVIAHETSHQWFGNLVTMQWWDDLWLNESFANMMEYVAVDAIYPDWKIWNEFISHEAIAALRRDQLPGVQAVRSEVNHPDEISTLFDPAIVYAKGSRLIKMLWQYVGDEHWREGLKLYFQKHAYGNTTGDDLWESLESVSGKDIKSFMSTWLESPGYPVVDVKTNATEYELEQQQFLIGSPIERQPIWTIPLAARNDTASILMDKQSLSVPHEMLALPINSNDKGHYIASYDEASQKIILQQLSEGNLSTVNRISFLHEQTLLAKAMRIETVSLLPLIDAFKNEKEEPVWGMLATAIGDLKRIVEDDETAEKNYKARVQQLASPLFTSLGMTEKNGETESDTKLRSLILALMSYSDHQGYIDSVLRLYQATPSIVNLPSETRPVILGTVIKHGSQEDFDTMLALYDTTSDPELKDDLVAALCQTKDVAHIQLLLDRLTKKNLVRPQDVTRWFVGLLRSSTARELTWQWLTSNWDWVLATYRGDKSYDNFARYSASILAGSKWVEAYKQFFAEKASDPALNRTITVGMTELKTKTEWLETQQPAVIAALTQ